MESEVILTMKGQHKLKMIVDYEASKVRDPSKGDLPGL
jgi:hypothetical protein